jgi:hypothetical protein
VINSWTCHLLKRRGLPVGDGIGDLLLVGSELTANFTAELALYLKALEIEGKSSRTLDDRKSIMWGVQESAVEMFKANELPIDFSEAVKHLIDNAEKSVNAVATEIGVCEATFARWYAGSCVPSNGSLPVVERLEDYFGLERGVLFSRLEHIVNVCRKGPVQSGTTPWREHVRTLHKYPYSLKELPPVPKAEFADLILFHTDDAWLEINDFDRNSEWVVWKEDGNIPSARKLEKELCLFFGYLNLPADNEHQWLTGKGMPLDAFTLALVSDAEKVLGYIEFLRERTYSQSYNTGLTSLIAVCASLLRPKTGFLWQQPQYGSKLSPPVPEHEWRAWCEKNRDKMTRFWKKKSFSKNKQIVMTRDPFAAVRQFIEELQHPISVLMEMASRLKRMIPLLEKGDPVRLALHGRNLAFSEFITSYPMRVRNWSWMTWIPKNPADIHDPLKKYVPTEEHSNLYQKSDGTWWIRFPPEGVKNFKRIDVPVAPSVVPSLVNYLKFYRPVLNGAIKEALNKRRKKFNIPALTTKEERAIDLCPFFLRPGPTYIHNLNTKKLSACKGVERMRDNSVSQCIFRLSQKYIPNCKGFCAHAVRHLVASEHIKNKPHGFTEAAAALNDSERTVRKHYVWVRPCDQIKPWHEHHEKLKAQLESEDDSGEGSET